MEISKINPNAQFYTVLKRDCAKTAWIFIWDFGHWLRFDSEGRCPDIRYYGTGKTYKEALEIIARDLPDCRSAVKYCPKSFVW